MPYKSFLSALALLAQHSYAQTQADIEAYPFMAEKFALRNMTWEPVKFTTEDGYTITSFHITGNENGPIEVTKNAVVMIHGMGGDSTEYVQVLRGEGHTPMAFSLAEAGHDVWLFNIRGNSYGLEHDVYSVDDEEFWAFDWRHNGVYDLPALVDVV